LERRIKNFGDINMKLSNRVHSEFIVFDIGERYIKALFVRYKWNGQHEYIYGLEEETDGIEDQYLVDLRKLSECIFKIIYKIEIEVGVSVKCVSILLSFGQFKIKKFDLSVYTNGIVNANHIEWLNNQLVVDSNETILGCIFDYYELDNLKYIENPIDMCGNNLKYKGQAVIYPTIFIRNILSAFHRHKIDVEYISFIPTINHTQIKENDYILIDMGYRSTRVLMKNHNCEGSFFDIKIGFFNIIHKISETLGCSLSKAEEIITLSPNQSLKVAEICSKILTETFIHIFTFINKSNFIYKYNTNIYLNGGLATVPLIKRFIELKFDKKVEILSTNKDFFTSKNHNIFNSCVHMANFIFDNSKK
jgi:cell division ATPase FtsA